MVHQLMQRASVEHATSMMLEHCENVRCLNGTDGRTDLRKNSQARKISFAHLSDVREFGPDFSRIRSEIESGSKLSTGRLNSSTGRVDA